MAYPITTVTREQGGGTTYTQDIPPGHQANDILVFEIYSNSTTALSTPSGWTSVGATGLFNSVARKQVFWKLAASSSESPVSLTGGSATWVGNITVWRGADTTAPIDGITNTDYGAVTPQTSPTITPTYNHGTIVYSWTYRGGTELLPQNAQDLTPIDKFSNVSDGAMIIGYRNQETAATTTAVNAISSRGNTISGRVFVYCIKDANPSAPQKAPDSRNTYTTLKYHSGITGSSTTLREFSHNETTVWYDFTDGTNGMSPTTIGGLGVISATPSIGGTFFSNYTYASCTGISVGVSAIDATGRWVGANYNYASAQDLTGKIYSVEFGMNSLTTGNIGERGCLVVFEDSSGDWAAFQLSERSGMTASVGYRAFIACDTATPYDSSGTIDWSDIRQIGYLYHRVTTSTLVRAMLLRFEILLDKTIVYGGNAGSPVNAGFIAKILNGWGAYDVAGLQGFGQLLSGGSIQFGNGTNTTYVELSGNSVEQRRLPNGTFERRFYQGASETLTTGFDLASSDTTFINRSILASAQVAVRQYLDFSLGSAPLTFLSSGMTLQRQIVTGLAGIDFVRTTFDDCTFNLNGSNITACTINGGDDAVTVTTGDPGLISDCIFTSYGSGHAIEITGTGTFDFYGNTFTDYGADTTDDAAIFNDSGGLVTLTLQAGDNIPTVKNGSGASTVFDTPSVDITVQGLVDGSRVQVYNVTQNAEIDNDIVSGTTYSYTVTSEADNDDVIRIRATYLGDTPFEQNGVFSDSAGLTILADQPEDTIYTTYGVDGSTVATIDWDGVNIQFDFDESDDIYSAKELYAWYNYYITTATGIADVFGLLEALDVANIKLGDVMLDNVNVNTIAPSDTVRLYREDGDFPVINPTSGGGGISLYGTGFIFTVNVEGSPVITGDIADVPTATENAVAVWSDTDSYSAGTKGNLLEKAKSWALRAFGK